MRKGEAGADGAADGERERERETLYSARAASQERRSAESSQTWAWDREGDWAFGIVLKV